MSALRGAWTPNGPDRARAVRVRIYADEGDRVEDGPLTDAVVHLLWRLGAAGVTVIRGEAGFGARRREQAGANAPMLIEWVDEPERHEQIWPELQPLLGGVLVTREKVDVIAVPLRTLTSLEATLVVDDVMSQDVTAVEPSTPVEDVVATMLERRLRFVPVCEDDRLVGVITNGDLVARAGLAARLELHAALGDSLGRVTADGLTAARIMTPDPVAVLVGTSVGTVARLMTSRGIKRVPVLRAGRLVGVVSRYDLLRAVAGSVREPQPFQALTSEDAQRVAGDRVGDAAVTGVPTVHPDTPLADVVEAMVSTRLNRAVVIDDDGHVVGIISDSQLLRRVGPAGRGIVERLMRRGGNAPAVRGTAADVMVASPAVVRSDAAITDAIRQMITTGAKLLPVVDEGGRLVGMLDRSDVLRAAFGTQPRPGE